MAEVEISFTDSAANLVYKGFTSDGGSSDGIGSIVRQALLTCPGGPAACGGIEYSQSSSFVVDSLEILEPASKATRRSLKCGSALVPELAFLNSGKLTLANGVGELRDGLSGLPMYSGNWLHGFRHGKGKAVLSDSQGQSLGGYEGDWVFGMRHGRGTLIEEGTGYRYDGAWALDRRHGPGVETLPGGGSYRGYWSKGKRHGCGVFTWPSSRTEMREYEAGVLVAARASEPSALHALGSPPTMSRIASRFDMATLASMSSGSQAGHGVPAAAVGATGAPTSVGSIGALAGGAGSAEAIAGGDVSVPTGAAAGTGGHLDTSTLSIGLPGDAVDLYSGPGSAGAGPAGPLGLPLGMPLGAGLSLPVAVPMPVPGGPGVQFAVQLPLGPPGMASAGAPMPGGVPSITLRLNADVIRLLKHTTVDELPKPRGTIISVDSTDKLENALTRMTEMNVLSLPVRNPASGVFTAVVHLLDVCAFLLDLVAKKKATFSPVAGGLRETLAHQKRFAQSPVSEVLEMTSHIASTAFKPLPSGCPLIFAAQTLADGVHAIPIVDAEGNITRMLTQADVIRFLAAHVDELGPLGQVTIGQLLPELGVMASAAASGDVTAAGQSSDAAGGPGTDHMSPAPLIVSGLRDRSMEVLQRMRSVGAPAAAVVDAYGGMVANLSFSDLKTVARKANFSALSLPVQAFLAALDRREVMNPSIVVRAGTPLSSVLLTLAATRIHQLYFVDEQLHPVAAIRTGDVLRILVGGKEA